MTGGTVGKAYYVEKLQEIMYVNQRVADIKTSKYINSKYIYYFIISPYVQKQIQYNKNSTNDNISMNLIESFILPIPPQKEQIKIVNLIDTLLSYL